MDPDPWMSVYESGPCLGAKTVEWDRRMGMLKETTNQIKRSLKRTSFTSSNYQYVSEPFLSKQTCSECMQTPTCAWCMQPDQSVSCFRTPAWVSRPAASACRLPPVPGACSLTAVFHVSEPLLEQADLQRVHADSHLCLVLLTAVFHVSEPLREQADLQRVHADAHLCLVHAALTKVYLFQNPCVSKQTCSECMPTPTCAWCMQPDSSLSCFRTPAWASRPAASACRRPPVPGACSLTTTRLTTHRSLGKFLALRDNYCQVGEARLKIRMSLRVSLTPVGCPLQILTSNYWKFKDKVWFFKTLLY